MFTLILPLLILFQTILSDKAAFQAYFSPKTIDEVRYIVVALEEYVIFYHGDFKPKQEYLSTLNKNQLTDYTTDLVAKYCNHFENIESFNRTIKKYPENLPIDSIITNGERQFLYKWAINADKYKRRMTQTSHLLGGLIDYAQYMSQSDLRAYIQSTITEYPELNSRSLFDQEILNIQTYKENTYQYIQEAPKDVLCYWINNLDLYLINLLQVTNAIGHDNCFKADIVKEALQKEMYNVLKSHRELLEIDNFFQVIDYKNIYYTPLAVSLNNESAKSIKAIALGCEEYNRKQKKLKKSFRGLMEYYVKVPIENLKEYAISIIREYPELQNYKLIDDLIENNKRQNYEKVKETIKLLERKDLITYYLNAKTTDNETHKLNDDLNTIFRKSDSDLTKMLLNISSSYPNLQTQTGLKRTVELNNNSLTLWLEQMPPNILGSIGKNLSQIFSDNDISTDTFFFESSEKEIIERILTLANLHNISSPKNIEQLINRQSNTLDETIPLYHGMYNYFRSINTETLFTWIKTFEQYHRQRRKLTNIIGGVANKRRDKKYYIGQLFFYLETYPDYRDQKKFDEFVGFDKVHDFLYSVTDKKELCKIAITLKYYHKRMSPNLRYSMNIKDDYCLKEPEMIDEIYLRYYIFKLMAIYPELNISEVVKELVMIPNGSNVIDLLNYLFEEQLLVFAKQTQNYLNFFNDFPDKTKLDGTTEDELRYYILIKHMTDPRLKHDIARLAFGQSEYLFKNYEEFFYRQEKSDLILFAKRMEVYDKTPEQDYDFNKMSSMEICNYFFKKMHNLAQLNDGTEFDRVINYIEGNNAKEVALINKLKESSRYDLIKFCSVVAHFHFSNEITIGYPKMYMYLISATKNELIRYILTEKKRLITKNDLIIYTRQLFVDYGEQSILDLVEFS